MQPDGGFQSDSVHWAQTNPEKGGCRLAAV